MTVAVSALLPRTRTGRSLWSLAASVLFALVTTGLALVSTPWILRWLGAERFGLHRTLLDLVAYVAIFELGVLGAARARIALAYGAHDRRAALAAVLAAFRSYVSVVGLMAAGGAALLWWIPRIVDPEAVSAYELRQACAIMLLSVLLAPLSLFRVCLEAQQRLYVLKAFGICNAVLSVALSMTLAWLGWGLPGQAVALVLPQATFAFAVAWWARRQLEGSWRATPAPAAGSAQRALQAPTLAYEISGRVALFSDNIIVAAMIAPAAVAPFYLTQRLAMLALGQLQEIGNATWAPLVELHAGGAAALFRERLLQLTNYVSSAAIVVLVPIAVLNGQFVTLWVGESNYAGFGVTALCCANVWMWALSSLWGWPVSGAGRIAHWTPYAIAGAAINVLVSIAVTRAIGWYGPLVGTASGLLGVTSWALPVVLRRNFDVAPRLLYAAACRPFLWGVPYALAVAFSASTIDPQGWTALVAVGAGASLAGLAAWWCLGVSAPERQLCTAWVRSALLLPS